MKKEIEARLLGVNKDEIRKNLEKLNFQLLHPERMMKRKAFHFENDIKNGKERWGRVRDEGHQITMTIKEIKSKNDINGVFESEIIINSFEEGVNLLKALGMNETAYQETYREEWVKSDEHIHMAIDTWPHLDAFLEIEAPEDEVVKFYANELGLDFSKATFGGVDVVYNKVYGIDGSVICKLPKITFDLSWEEILDGLK